MKIRVLFAGLLCVAFSLSAFAYTDLDNSMEFKYAIDAFTEEGIVEGYGDGTFRPNQPINRAEAMKVITLTFPDDNFVQRENIFNDTQEGEWFYSYIIEGISRNIIEGYGDGTFRPANQVNFAESLKMGLVAKGISQDEIEYSDFHYEINASDWYAKYFKYAFDKYLFDLDANGDIDPVKPMNRGDFVELMYRIKNLDTDDPEEKFDFSYNWDQTILKNGFAVKAPFKWETHELENGIMLGYFKSGNPNFISPTPDSVRIGFFFWVNPENKTSGAYFNDLEDQYEDMYSDVLIEYSSTEFGPSVQFTVDDEGLIDYYIYLDDGRILAAHGRYDVDSALVGEFKKQVYKAYDEIDFLSLGGLLTVDEKLELVRENILVEGEGQNMIDLFAEVELFETDTLGVGTGPVDYYYVSEADYTFKYERENNTVLDIHEGETSSF